MTTTRATSELPDGRRMQAEIRLRHVLQIRPDEAGLLFRHTNTPATAYLRVMRHGGEIQIPPHFTLDIRKDDPSLKEMIKTLQIHDWSIVK